MYFGAVAELVGWFDKIVWRPFSHIPVLHGTNSSLNNAILNVRSTAQRAEGRMPGVIPPGAPNK